MSQLPYEHPLCVEVNVTRAYREAYHLHPARREIAALRGQFPYALHDVEPGDLFAGRCYLTPNVFAPRYGKAAAGRLCAFRVPALGFAALRPAYGCSAPFFWDAALWRSKRQEAGPQTPALEQELDALEQFWEAEDPVRRCVDSLPGETKHWAPQVEPLGVAAAMPLVRFTGPMLDFAKLVDLGLPGLAAQVASALDKPGVDSQALLAMQEGLALVADCALWYAQRCTDQELAADLRSITQFAPATLRQGMQVILLWGVISSAYQWGRLDDALGRLLAQDLAQKRLDEDGACALIASMWRIIHDNGAEFDNRVIIGGRGRRNPVQADHFARLAMQVTARCGLVLPQLSLRFHRDQDPALYRQALDAIGGGCTFPMLYQDEVNIPAVMQAFAVSEAEAEQYVPFGCGEYVLCGRSVGTPSAALNVALVLDATLRGGRDALGRRQCPAGPSLDQMRDFSELWQRFSDNCRFLLHHLAVVQAEQYAFNNREAGFVLFSMLYDDCIVRGRCLLDGGVRYLGGTMESYGQINAADALLAIRRLIFEQRTHSAQTLLQALAANFQGHQALHRQLMAQPAYGNDDPDADHLAAEVHRMICTATRDQAASVGLHSFLVVVINNMMHTVLGKQTPATADGRLAGATFANGNNPQPGRDTQGSTAFLSSLAKLDPAVHAGASQNMKFARSLFREQRPKLEALLATYWSLGGAQAMLTVIDRGMLEEAQRYPERHPHLMVRVGGFSARFIELGKAVQDEVIARTCHV